MADQEKFTVLEFFDPPIFKIIDRDVIHTHNPSQTYWWKHHSGYTLAVMLYFAEYPTELQYIDLRIFADHATSSLGNPFGVKRLDMKYQWRSFMTDDCTPIELSWDWGIQNDPPTIRCSIKPVGVHAGTSLDPFNKIVGVQFHERVLQSLEEFHDDWFEHFSTEFNQPWTSKSLSLTSTIMKMRGTYLAYFMLLI